jgi:hypothetical protein
MKKLAIINIVIFLSLFFIIPWEARAQNAVESFENGKIDWTTGVGHGKKGSCDCSQKKPFGNY